MTLSFRKRIKVFPGVYINFSKRGMSTTIGPRGANINIGGKGVFLNTGIPGTGLYSRKKITKTVNTLNSSQWISNERIKSEKFKLTTILLALFLGTFGIHRFYLGQKLRGIFSILFCWTLIPTLISLSDVWMFATMSQDDFDIKYNNYESWGNSYNNTLVLNDSYTQKTISTSQNLEEIKKNIKEARLARNEILEEIKIQHSVNRKLEIKLIRRKSILGKIFESKGGLKKIEDEFKNSNEYLEELYSQYDESSANINFTTEQDIEEQYLKVEQAFIELTKSHKIWDITSEVDVNSNKSVAKKSVDRKEVKFILDDIDFIQSSYSAFHLENRDGNNLYIYPAFILQLDKSGEIVLIDLNELNIKFKRQRFLQDKLTIPKDTEIVDYTWEKVNKDGTPDRRFVNNYQIPVVEYGVIEIYSDSGLKETYYVSNLKSAENFTKEFQKYLTVISPNNKDLSDIKKITSISSNMQDFSYNYYSLLKDFSKSFSVVVNKILSDQSIIDGINNLFPNQASTKFINNCIFYDLIKIMNLLSEGKLSTSSLEATGMVLLTYHLTSKNRENLLESNFDKIVSLHKNGNYQEVAKQLIEISRIENPTFSIVNKMLNNNATQSVKIEHNLSLPSLLKALNNQFFDEYTTSLYRYATIIFKSDEKISKSEESILNKIYQITHYPVENIKIEKTNFSKMGNDETIDDVLNELNSLIGLNDVKNEINTLINFIRIQKAREQSGLKSSSLSYHIVFTGNPGTGKTTVARIVANIYKKLGILSVGQLVETDRSGLIAEYAGQTAVKVNNVVNSALDGILFIDEAYSLVGENNDNFGNEAVATLIKRMEDDRDKLVLILAGYTDEMNDFIDTNPGFKSRFNRYINFPDYAPDELFEIFESMCSKLDYYLTNDAKFRLKQVFESSFSNRDKSFGNGRYVRNVFEKTIENQANRISKEKTLTKEILKTIEAQDIPVNN